MSPRIWDSEAQPSPQPSRGASDEDHPAMHRSSKPRRVKKGSRKRRRSKEAERPRLEDDETLDFESSSAWDPEPMDDHDEDLGGFEEEEAEPFVLDRPEHSVSRKHISPGALKVLYRLKKLGYRSYLCGGAVRDLMLGRRPKDFDVATEARPHEIKRAFRNARIIGRRFRLAHIIFHDEIVEVSTFRRTPDPDEQAGGPEDLLITNDNTYGTPLEDAFRRDFTINALYYNIEDFSVVDYCGGIDDLDDGLIRVIGDPQVRFCEDPVRMMRACEFAGRLGFSVEEETQKGIRENRRELMKAAPARMTEELLQLLKSGHVSSSMQWMLDLGVLKVVLPEALSMIEAHERGAGSFTGILPVLDEMVDEDRHLSDPVLLGALLLPDIMLRRFDYEERERKPMASTQFRKAVEKTLKPFSDRYSIAKHKRAMLSHALDGFHRMCSQEWTHGQRIRFASKSYFEDALVLFEILVRATGEGEDMLELWHGARKQRRSRPKPQVERKGRTRRRRGRR